MLEPSGFFAWGVAFQCPVLALWIWFVIFIIQMIGRLVRAHELLAKSSEQIASILIQDRKRSAD